MSGRRCADRRVPLAMRLLGKGLRKTEVDAGIQGAGPGEPPAFFGGCQFYFDTVDAFLAVWPAAAAELGGDPVSARTRR